MIRILSIIVIVLSGTFPLLAQQTETAAPAPEVRESNRDQTREELHSILDRYPPEVGRVLALDPTLLRNESWLATYPALQKFVSDHPEVAHSPGFFLERFSRQEAPPPTSIERFWSAMMESFVMFTTITIFLLVSMWFARTIIEHKRWSRMARSSPATSARAVGPQQP